MFKFFSKTKDIDEIVFIIINISNSPKNPLFEHFDFSRLQKGELLLTNMLYCIRYLLNHNTIKFSMENANKLIASIYLQLKDMGMIMDYESFTELAEFRNEIFFHELGQVRQTMLSTKRYFPKDYFTRILEHPMTFKIINDYSKYEEMNFNDKTYFFGLYTLQINYLQKELEKNFK